MVVERQKQIWEKKNQNFKTKLKTLIKLNFIFKDIQNTKQFIYSIDHAGSTNEGNQGSLLYY